jgi:hypothetical protein
MTDLPRDDTLNPVEPDHPRRALTLRRRVEGAVLGAVSGAVTGWLAVLVGGIVGVMHWWVVAGLAVLAAVLGYRYGRSVVAATLMAFTEAN